MEKSERNKTNKTFSESLGKSLRRFKKATSEVEEEVKSALQEQSKTEEQNPTSISKSDSSNHSE